MGIFKKPEYQLKNIVEWNKRDPRHFLKPTDHEIKNLKIGDVVRLIFVMREPSEDNCEAERMWVVIQSICGDKYIGRLDSQPYYLKTIKRGDEIAFSSENIATVLLHRQAPFDEKQLAIITKKALEMREINWIIQSDERYNEQDSGWQLFYGDEDQTYLDNPDHLVLISLESVLNFEPLAEKPFTENGLTYQYSEADNGFIEVRE